MEPKRKPTPPGSEDPEVTKAEAELIEAQKKLAWEMSKAAVDVAGIVDPTPISDAVGMSMSLADGDLIGAALSVLGMVPYLGDALGKTAKGARTAKRMKELGKEVAASIANVNAVKQTLKPVMSGLEKAKQARDFGRQHLKSGIKTIMKCPKMAPQVKAAARVVGISRATAARMIEICKKHGVVVKMRPTNKDSIKWINKGHPPKPGRIKSKTISELDEHIGAPKGLRGQVAYFEPSRPSTTLKGQKTKDGKDLYEEAQKKFENRRLEYNHETESMKQLIQEGRIYGEITKEGKVLMPDGLVIDKHSGKAFAGDNDVFQITKADGTILDPVRDAALRKEVLKDLAKPPTNIQHPDVFSWRTQNLSEEKIKQGLIDRHTKEEALGVFSPDGFRAAFHK